MKGNPNMETIMSQIKEHLKPTIDHGANGNINHYNQVWGKIERWASMPPNQENSTGASGCIRLGCSDRGDWFCDPSCSRFKHR